MLTVVILVMSSKSGANPAEPTYVGSARELEDTFNEMRPIFEGKESEQNWGPRDKSILKLRKITKGELSRGLDHVVRNARHSPL